MKWCPGTESNCRHGDFQSPALPTELPGRLKKPGRYIENAMPCPVTNHHRHRSRRDRLELAPALGSAHGRRRRASATGQDRHNAANRRGDSVPPLGHHKPDRTGDLGRTPRSCSAPYLEPFNRPSWDGTYVGHSTSRTTHCVIQVRPKQIGHVRSSIDYQTQARSRHRLPS